MKSGFVKMNNFGGRDRSSSQKDGVCAALDDNERTDQSSHVYTVDSSPVTLVRVLDCGAGGRGLGAVAGGRGGFGDFSQCPEMV